MSMKYVPLVMLSATASFAEPTLEQVVSGTVSLSSQGQQLIIDQSTTEAWLDWSSFSIAADESVVFQLLDDQGLTVNRVTGDDLSTLLGQLQSNGTVYLINPNGILFGDQAQVDVGGLFATDHWLSQDGVLTPGAMSQGIKVLGNITSRGDLTLLANQLENQGAISANNIALLASEGALLSLDAQGAVSVLVPTSGGKAWVKNSGVLVANEQIYIGSADKNSWLNELAQESQVTVSGRIEAQQIDIVGTDIELLDANLTAELVDIESRDTTYIRRSQLSSVDGNVRIRGNDIQLIDHTSVDVGTGQLTIGGQFQGAGDDHNARFVHVSSTTHLYGNAGAHGNGGEIILWSDGTTSFHGYIEAKGGTQSGNGGFVEVSGKDRLVFRGDVRATATQGERGTLLLDPTIITVKEGYSVFFPDDGDGDEILSDADDPTLTGNPATIYEDTLEAISAGTDISLVATERIEFADLTDGGDQEYNFDQGLSLTVNAGSGGSIVMLGADDTLRFSEDDLLSIIVNGNGNGVNSYVDLSNVVFDAGGDFSINIQHSGDGTSGAYVNVGNVTNSGSTTANDLNFLVNNSSAAPQINVQGDITWAGNGAGSHRVVLTTQTGGVTAGTINLAGDITVPDSDITITTNTLNLTDATATLTTFDDVSKSLGNLTLAATTIDAGGNALALAGGSIELIDLTILTNLGSLELTTQNGFILGTGGSIDNTELLALTGISSLTLNSFGGLTAETAQTNFAVNLNADFDDSGAGNVIVKGLNTTDNDIYLSGVGLTGSALGANAGTGTITINSSTGASMSVNGGAAFNISSTVWDNLTASQITLQGVTGANQILWEQGTLGQNLVLDGSTGAGVVFQNGPFNFAGTNSIQTIGDTYLLSDFTMSHASSAFDVDGTLIIGEANAGAGDTSTVVANFVSDGGLTAVTLAGDTGDSVSITNNTGTNLTLTNISAANDVDLTINNNMNGMTVTSVNIGSGDLTLSAEGAVTASDLTAGNVDITFDDNNDESGLNQLTLSGTNSVANLELTGTNTNDIATLSGTWTISGNVSTSLINTLRLTGSELSATSLDFSALNTLSLSVGGVYIMTSTSGDISLADVASDRPLAVTSAGQLNIKAITTSDDNVQLKAADVTGNGSAINVGSAQIEFITATDMSVGDAGTAPFNIEANIWDNITAGTMHLDVVGTADNITFLEDTLPADLTIFGANGNLTFDGVAQNFTGASLTTNQQVVFKQNFTSDSAVTLSGNIAVGATDAAGGDTITLQGDFQLGGALSMSLLGDTGDGVVINHIGNADLTLPAISSSNGDPSLTLNSSNGISMAGYQAGNLTVVIDSDNSGVSAFTTSGNYNLGAFQLSGLGGDDTASLDGNWTLGSTVLIDTLANLSFVNDSFVAGTSLTVANTVPITLGASATTFNLAANSGNLSVGDITSSRPLNITATGSVTAGTINNAAQALSLTSDSDSAGDEAINVTTLQAGNLNLAGDFVWDFNATLTGNYVQTRGDVTLNGTTINASDIDLSAADSLTLSGTASVLVASAGDIVANDLNGGFANITMTASNDITLTTPFLGMGGLTLTADSDTDSNGVATLSNSIGDLLTLNSDAHFQGITDFSQIVATSTITLTDAAITVDTLDTSGWTGALLAGTSNSVTTQLGALDVQNWQQSTGSSNLTLVSAAGISISNSVIGGQLAVNAANDTTSLTDVSAGNIVANNDTLTIASSFDASSLTTTGGLVFTDANASFDSFDNTDFSSVSFTGTTNTLTTQTGDITLNAPTVNSALTLVSATGISVSNTTASGSLSVNAGNDATSLTAVSASNVVGNNDTLTIESTLNTGSIITSGGLVFTNANTTLDGFDSTDYSSVSFTGTSNTLTTDTGAIALDAATVTSALTLVSATGISVSNTAANGSLSVNAGNDATSLTDVSAGTVDGNNDTLTFVSSFDADSITTTGGLVFANANTTLNSLDSADYGSVSFIGSANTLTIDAGLLLLDAPTITTGSDLTMNLGSGSHELSDLNVGTGAISITGLNGTNNRQVTAQGTWAYNELNVSNIDSFINAAQLNGSTTTSVNTTTDILFTDGSTLVSDSITLSAGNDIQVTGLTTDSVQLGAISISAGGDILDAGDTNADITAYWKKSVELEAGGTIDPGLAFVYDIVVEDDLSTEIDVEFTQDSEDLLIADAEQAKNPTQSSQATVGSLPRSSVDVQLPECSGDNQKCRKTSALRRFLGSLLIGGALPN